jgi:hypothetical protein
MNANQYEDARLDTDSAPVSIMDIDTAEDAYDPVANTVRVIVAGSRKMRLFLAFTGTFVFPDPSIFKVAAFYNKNMQPNQDQDWVMPGIAFLVDVSRFEPWNKIHSTAMPSAHVNVSGAAAEGRETVIKARGGDDGTGISVREDGTILLKASHSEIVMGDGILLKGKMKRDSSEKRAGVMKENSLGYIPSFCALPLARYLAAFDFVERIGGYVVQAAKIAKLSSLA